MGRQLVKAGTKFRPEPHTGNGKDVEGARAESTPANAARGAAEVVWMLRLRHQGR